MKQQQTFRWKLWLPLLLGAAALAGFGDKGPNNGLVDASTSTQSGAAGKAVASSGIANNPPVRTGKTEPPVALTAPVDRELLFPARPRAVRQRDLFSSTTWAPPPPAAAPVASRPIDTTPPMPSLTVIGKKQEAGLWEVYLTQGTQTLIAREGETVDGDLRVDRIAPPEMFLTQLSTGRPLTLGIGDAR
jgi:hypothetical protein